MTSSMNEVLTRSYAAAQRLGDRLLQCDATSAHGLPDGIRAYALLDGIGDTPDVRAWTRAAARRLARAAAVHADAETGPRTERARYAADPARADRDHTLPEAAAVVAVHAPGGLLSVAWSGGARAYLLLDGRLRLLTEDHNARRAYGRDRNLITACLRGSDDDQETEQLWGHPAVEALRGPARPACPLLASDGAYEPLEDAGHDLADHLTGEPHNAAERLVGNAIRHAHALPTAYADNATVLITRL
ncbi:hypothetical protein K353_05815 [Kitasatospora sp. SolWspMP-SS2h]|uniref:hypothetical protein n=1 Tax=Kitasatospora sp. SolWspMP-SS2h TaxID=1305729 RepID=UPI000DBFD72C|nr:hypothetical protein [Kitasatospora sp. SolWspMP-SS2h]RAJ32817.1 hypothetical protein K353_05815 [Kitasatospora sp. SolWspMP-SS2h]